MGATEGNWDLGALKQQLLGPAQQPGEIHLAAGGRVGAVQSTDRLMAPALHTIEFALLSLPALGKDLSSSGLGSAGPDSIKRDEGAQPRQMT